MAAAAAAVSLGACAYTAPAGPVAAAERLILINALLIMLALGIPLILALLAFAWWFRAGNHRARYRPTWAYSGRLELLTWSIPLLTIMFLAGLAWIGSHELDPAKPLPSKQKPLEVQVVSLDWKWLFIYSEQGVASINRMVVPAGTPLHLTLTSASVFNVFWAPRLGSEIYTMNGMSSQLWLQADRPGDFPGLSGHFSGDGFSGMHFNVQAVDAGAFAGWVAAARSAGPALDEAGYRALLPQTHDVAPYTYSRVQPGLYDAVVRQMLPPGEGPKGGRSGPQVSPKPIPEAPSGKA